MFHSTIGRCGIAVAVTSVFFAAACGTQTEQVDDVQPGAPAVVQGFPHMSADSAERQGKSDYHPPMSADSAERQGAKSDKADKAVGGHPTTPDSRIPD